ncbi:fungal-specific transcription factor domain-containing protein [Aspergillus multicolor]|uniref:Zn(II)2Cys6 transcription factor n=1 Tax=Aspergillus multicolor TaxID=41759 RepID=UPI003CCD60FA
MKLPKSSIQRTRAGCWSCKKRRRRCDEKKPSCGGCQKRGLPCQYGIKLLWEHEADSLGIAFGRSTKNPLGRTHYLVPIQPHAARHWLNTTSDDINRLYSGPSCRRDYALVTGVDEELAPALSIALYSLSHYPSHSEADQFLFYYFTHTCTIRRSLIESENPWRSVVLPLCYQSDGLLHMAIAWAAHILRNQCASQDVPHYEQMILTQKCHSLKYLRTMVPQSQVTNDALPPAETKSERDALLLLVMFHCLLEIASGSTKEWTYHMNGALIIIKFYTNLGGTNRQDIFSQEVVQLVHSFFLEKGTFLGTSTSTPSSQAEGKHLASLEWSTEIPNIFPYLAGRGSVKIDPCMGLSFELLDIISCITDLSRRRQTGTMVATQEFTSLIHRLQRLEASSGPIADDPVSDSDITALHASAFQSASWIYLYHTLANLPFDNATIQGIHLPVLLSTLAQIHKHHGTLLGFLPYPMWALFIASCVVLEEGRVQILEWFSVLNSRKPVSNVPSTLAAVKAIWKKRDLAECAGPTHTRNKGLVWIDAIGELGWLMPFT